MNSTVSPYEDLASAIILQAVKDYWCALESLVEYPNDRRSLSVKQEVEQFFRSDWFGILTKLDSEMLISKLCKEVA